MIIGTQSFDLEDVAVLYDQQGVQIGSDVLMTASQASAITPTFRHPPGTVLIKRTSTGKYLLATDANADDMAPAAVSTLVTNPGSGGGDGNLVLTGHWGTITVALSGANTDAAVAAAVIAAIAAQNPEGQARVTAADTTGEVTFTNLDVGEGTWLHAVHATVTTMLGAAGQTSYGTDPDVRVTRSWVDLENLHGTAVDGMVPTFVKGRFRTAGLSSLTGVARAVLAKRGSTFH